MGLLIRLLRLLRPEDLIVTALAALALPIAEGWVRGASTADPAGDPSVLTGILGLIAVAGVLACVLTRGPDEPPPLADGHLTLQGWARFPLAAGLGIVAVQTLPGLGVDPDPFAGIAFLATFAGAVLHPRLPEVPVVYRRAMVLPMMALAAGAFDRIIGRGLGDMFGAFFGGTAPAEVAALWPLILGAVGMLYVMLVVAPRAIADPGAGGVAWVVRFAFLVGSIAVAAALGIR